MKKSFFAILAAGLALVSAAGCQDEDPCQSGQTHGKDGLCYLPPNWGDACTTAADCTGGLFCGAPDLPICTLIECDVAAGKDNSCPDDFTCTKTGRAEPEPQTVCIPRPPTAEECGEKAAGGAGGAGGASPGPVDAEQPNLGTPCTLKDDPICKGGTVCETEQLNYCVIFSCAEGCKNAAICAAAGFTCYLAPPSPSGGTCVDL